MAGDQEVLIQLAEMRQQMCSLNQSLDEMKMIVKEVLALDKAIAELSVRHKQTIEETGLQWSRIDALTMHVNQVDKKADEWINKGRGAWSTVIVLGSVIQAAVFSFVMYTFSHMRTAEDAVLVMQQQLNQQKEIAKK